MRLFAKYPSEASKGLCGGEQANTSGRRKDQRWQKSEGSKMPKWKVTQEESGTSQWRFHYPAQMCVQVHAASRRLFTQAPSANHYGSHVMPCKTSSNDNFSPSRPPASHQKHCEALQEKACLTLCLQPNVNWTPELKVPNPP